MSALTGRLDYWPKNPEIYRALYELTRAAKKGLGDDTLAELVFLRASFLNKCAPCIVMHTEALRAAGVSEQRISLVGAWEEAAGFYTEKERAALALTEAVTVLTDGFVPDAVYERAAAQFGERELAHLIGVITAINSWNRINVATRRPPGEHA